jgi:hypothetical protein
MTHRGGEDEKPYGFRIRRRRGVLGHARILPHSFDGIRSGDEVRFAQMTKRRATHLTDADHQRLRAKLSKKREELIAAQKSSTGEQRGLHDRETEQGDVAEEQIEQAAALRIGHFDAALLGDVELALKKIDEGTYGLQKGK